MLVQRDDEVWAYPLDDTEPYLFSPAFGPVHYGSEYVTAIGVEPDNEVERQLFRNRHGGQLEIIERNISGAVAAVEDESYAQHTWTPDFGRVLYGVRDGDAISIRQHALAD